MRGTWPRILLTLASASSLMLCVLAVALWIRSFVRADSYVASIDPQLKAFQSYRGALHYVHVSPSRFASSDRKHPPRGWTSDPVERALLWQEWNGPRRDSYTFLGFAYTSSLNNFTIAAVPYWLMTAVLAILPIWSVPRVLRWLRRPMVICPQCGTKNRGLVTKCARCGHALVATGPPPPPKHDAPPPPRPTKKVQSIVVKTVKREEVSPAFGSPVEPPAESPAAESRPVDRGPTF